MFGTLGRMYVRNIRRERLARVLLHTLSELLFEPLGVL
jgi:hypothetical protein